MKRAMRWTLTSCLVLTGGCAPASSPPASPPRASPLASPPRAAPPASSSPPAPRAATTVAPSGPERSVQRAITTAEAAVAAYFELFPKASAVPRNDVVMRARATLSAPCRESIERIVDTMGPSPALSEGTVEALDRDAPCWVVNVPVNPFHATQGYLDQATGDLLAVWDIPEG